MQLFYLTGLLSALEVEDAHAGSWKESLESPTAILTAPTGLLLSAGATSPSANC